MGTETAVVRMISVEKCVVEADFNTRQDLGDLTGLISSIKQWGIQEPLSATTNGIGGEVLIFKGFRRLAAAQELGFTEVPIVVHSTDSVSKQSRLVLNIVENVQREGLNPVDEAEGYLRLQMDFQLTEDDIIQQVGINKTRLKKCFRILQLRKVVKDAVRLGEVSIGASLHIDRLPENQQAKYVDLAKELSGARLRSMIDKFLSNTGAEPKEPKEVPPVDEEEKAKKLAVRECVKRIKQSSDVLCIGLGYVEEFKSEVKSISWGLLTDDDVKLTAKLFDDVADTVQDEIAINDKATAALESIVSETPDNRAFNWQDADVQEMVIAMIHGRAVALAKEAVEGTDKNPKITFASMREAIDEFYVDVKKKK